MGGVGHDCWQSGMWTKLLVVQLQVHPIVDLVVFQGNVVLQIWGLAGLAMWTTRITINLHLRKRTPGYKVAHFLVFNTRFTLKMVYHFFSTILSHLKIKAGQKQSIFSTLKMRSSELVLGASLCSDQFLQVSNCVVLVAFDAHLLTILISNYWLSDKYIHTFFPNLSLQVISIILVQRFLKNSCWFVNSWGNSHKYNSHKYNWTVPVACVSKITGRKGESWIGFSDFCIILCFCSCSKIEGVSGRQPDLGKSLGKVLWRQHLGLLQAIQRR